MHNKHTLKQLILGILATAMLGLPAAAMAKDINLYDSPNANSKVIGKIDIAAGVVPIFTPKPGDWMKVGDPRNGNTGWIKASDIQSANGPSSISFSQQIINDSSGHPHTYQLLQFGQPQQMTPAQSKKYMQQMQARQQAIQQEIQHEIDDMNRHFNSMQQGWPFMFHDNFPMIMPVVFVPVQNQPAKQAVKQPANQTVVKPKVTPKS